ncbi:MAG: hypothetical protein ABIQ01_01450 [Pseudolysinimonas sp.]
MASSRSGVRRALAGIAALAAAVATLTGCAPTASTEAPDGVRVSVYQPRPDVPKNRMAIQVHNDGDEPITITSAELHSSFFTDDMVWGPDRTSTVAPGYAVDLRVDLPTEADCSGAEPQLTATFGWTVGDSSGTAVVEPEDPFHLLDLLHDAACLIGSVDEVAKLTAVSLDAPAQLPAPAELVISVEATGAEGTVTLDTIHSTTLLNPAGPDGVGVAELDLGIVIDKDGPAEVRIPIVPNRCDAHALAEDKVGTRMPLYVTAPDGSSGRLVLSATDELRSQMYAFYSSFCSL